MGVDLRRAAGAIFGPICKAWKERTIEFLTLIVAAVTLGVLFKQLADVRQTIETQNQALISQNRQLESQAYSSILEGLRDLDKTFVENAKYRPYFVDNRQLDPGADEETRQKVFALAAAMLDFMDGFYSQEKHIDWQSRRYTREAWEIYFNDTFNCSAVLRQEFCRAKAEFGKDLNKLAGAWCNGDKAAPSKNPQKCQLE